MQHTHYKYDFEGLSAHMNVYCFLNLNVHIEFKKIFTRLHLFLFRFEHKKFKLQSKRKRWQFFSIILSLKFPLNLENNLKKKLNFIRNATFTRFDCVHISSK